MSVIAGIGWVGQGEYGCALRKLRRPCVDMSALRRDMQAESIFAHPVQRFGSYDSVSRLACCVGALALYDARMPYSRDQAQDVGILSTSKEGCLRANVDFFADFVEHGKELGRARLFVPTLPSIPVAQAAIHFNFRGPLLYTAGPGGGLPSLLRQSEGMIRQGEAKAMLALEASEDMGFCFLLRRERDCSAQPVLALGNAVDIVEGSSSPEEIVSALARF